MLVDGSEARAGSRFERLDPFGALLQVLRWLLILAGTCATLPVLASLLLRQVEVGNPRVVVWVAGTPFVLFAGLAAIVLFLVARAWAGVSISGVLTAILALTQAPLFIGSSPPPGPTTTLNVMTLNMRYGSADPDEIVDLVRTRDVDILTLEELTPGAERGLLRAGLDEVLPHSVATASALTDGNGLWSRYPLQPLPAPPGFRHPPVAATMDVDGHDVFVAAVHPLSPYPSNADVWVEELDALRDWLGTVDGRAVIGGDFNSTIDHRGFRDILSSGYHDAVEQSGAGFLPTYPANRRRIPLLIGIDHVISRGGIVATDVARVDVGGTDHATLIATLAVPTGLAPNDP